MYLLKLIIVLIPHLSQINEYLLNPNYAPSAVSEGRMIKMKDTSTALYKTYRKAEELGRTETTAVWAFLKIKAYLYLVHRTQDDIGLSAFFFP